MLPSRTYSVSIAREWHALYDAIWRPDIFPHWASGLTESGLRQEGEYWLADGADGPIAIRFTPHNGYGVMDHFIDIGEGKEIHVPMRVIRNGEGAEVLLTLFRQPDMTDEIFARDSKWITRDLRRLKEYVTR